MPLKACVRCGSPSHGSRCPNCQLPPRARGNGFEPTRQRIAERDQWICQLCGQPINPLLRRPHPMALHIDHVRRRADGGTEADENLRSTHARCNLERG
jgi:5-methylcytosine-specific restriction endonuclease McrA